MKKKIVTLILGLSFLAGNVWASCGVPPYGSAPFDPRWQAYMNCRKQEQRIEDMQWQLDQQEQRLHNMEMERSFNPGGYKNW